MRSSGPQRMAGERAPADAGDAVRSSVAGQILQCFPQGAMFLFDGDLRYVAAGGMGLAEVGLSRELMEGNTIFQVFGPQVVAVIEPAYRRALAGQESALDVPYQGRIYLLRLAPVRDDGGRIIAGMGFTQDVTSARGAERELRESEDRFRLAFEHAPIAKALIGLDGRYQLVNPAMCAFTGYTEQQLLGLPMARVSHPDDLDADLVTMAGLRAGGRTSSTMDKRYITVTGTVVWGAQSVTLVHNGNGAPLHFIAQIQDITARKHQERELVAERRRLRDAESTGMVGSWELDLDTDTVTWSNGMFELFGIDPERSGALYAAGEQIHPDDLPALDSAVEACVAGGDPIRLRYRVTRADGTPRWFDVRGEARCENGRRVRIGGTVIDVTDQVTAETEAATAHALQQAVVAASPDIIEVWDFGSGSSRWSNRPIGSALGYTDRDVVEMNGNLVGNIVHDDDRAAFADAMAAARTAADDQVTHLDYRMIAKDGSKRWFSRRTAPLMRGKDGRVAQIVSVIRDTTDAKAVEAALQESEARFRQLADNIDVGFVLRSLDPPGYLYVSPGHEKIFGYNPMTEDEAPASTLRRIIHPEDREAARSYWSKVGVGVAAQAEVRIVRPDGEVRWIRATSVPVVDGDGVVRRTASTVEDINDRKLAEEAVLHQSLHDPLTGLPNRNLLYDRIEHALAAAGRSRKPVGVLFVDLDGFKQVNDSFGHAAGDELLVQVAARLRHTVRPGDTVARLGGDEFAIVCADIRDLDALRGIAARVLAGCGIPFQLTASTHQLTASTHQLTGSTHRISASIGLQLISRPTDPDQVLSAADAAMYRAKSAGGNRISVNRPDEERSRTARLGPELHRAVAEDEFVMYGQPVVDLVTGHPTAMECLIRWQHPVLGVLTPGDFLDLAERSPLMVAIGRRALSESCRMAAAWSERFGAAAPDVHVNVSGRQLESGHLTGDVLTALDTNRVPADRLVLELTETRVPTIADSLRKDLNELRDRGVRIAIDDIGTGYSSLTRITELPVDMLKIDIRFVRGLGVDRACDAVVRAVLSLGETLGLSVVAEGVETPAQADLLRSYGCDTGQGYLYSTPRPEAEILDYLAEAGLADATRADRGREKPQRRPLRTVPR